MKSSFREQMTMSSHDVESHEERKERVEKKGKHTYVFAVCLDSILLWQAVCALKKIEILLHIYFKVLS